MELQAEKEQKIKEKHKDFFDLYRLMRHYKIVSSYLGPFDKFTLISLGKSLQNSVTESYTQSKKIFKIFLELASNIAYYSMEKEDGSGSGVIVINDVDDKIVINAGNVIDGESKDMIEKKCDLINSLNREELRKLKRLLLRMPAFNENSGNIGLVQIALLSNNPIKYLFIPLNEEKNLYFYIVAVSVNKKHQNA